MTWSSKFALLSREYGFSIAEILEMSMPQFSAYLSKIGVEKDDPAVEYEVLDVKKLDTETAAQARKLGLSAI